MSSIDPLFSWVKSPVSILRSLWPICFDSISFYFFFSLLEAGICLIKEFGSFYRLSKCRPIESSEEMIDDGKLDITSNSLFVPWAWWKL